MGGQKKDKHKNIPQILIGASSSSKLGCWRKISLEAEQSCLISASDNWTCFPGRDNRTSVSRRIMSSSTASSITWACDCGCGGCPCALIDSDSDEEHKNKNNNEAKGEPTKRECCVGLVWLVLSLCLRVTVFRVLCFVVLHCFYFVLFWYITSIYIFGNLNFYYIYYPFRKMIIHIYFIFRYWWYSCLYRLWFSSLETHIVLKLEIERDKIILVANHDDNYVFLAGLVIRNLSLRCCKF